LLAFLDLVGGVLCLLVALVGVAVGLFAGINEAVLMAVIGAIYLLMGAVQVAAGVGLLKLKPFGRALQIGLSIVGLLAIPLGTIISIVVLVYLFKPGVKLLFSGRAPQDLAPHEQEEVARAMGSTAVVVIVAVLVLLVVVATVGIIAAIAIPSLLRARVSANESSAMGDLRTVISAQAAYAASNGGFHDRLACMVEPGTCLPGYPPGAPRFLDPTMAQATRRGYVFTFHEGPRPTPGTFDPARVSPTSMTSFAYTAVPAQPNQTGVRGFCGDASGLLCFTTDGSEPRPVAGACPADCTPVR
jgi:type II secretory pathway pseudopilin PulG